MFDSRIETAFDEVLEFAGFIGAKSLAFFIGGLDDSGTHLGSRAIAAGAIIADINAWPEIRQRWKDTLSAYGVTHFHSSEYDSGWGEYSGWNEDQEKKISFIKELITVVSVGECKAFAYGNYTQFFDEAIKKIPQEEGFDLYSLCAEMCAGYALGHFDIGKSRPQLNLIIPKKPVYHGELLRHWMESSPPFTVQLSSDSKSVTHQIADLIAREHYKYLDKLPDNIREHGYGVQSLFVFRKSFHALLKTYVSPAAFVDCDLERILTQRKEILSNES